MANHTSLSSLFKDIADAIRAKEGTADAIVADEFPTRIANIASANVTSGLRRFITNDDSITPTGTYATSAYYNTAYGVKVGYCPDGTSILLSMKSGSSTSYEHMNFVLASAPTGVSIVTNNTAWGTSDPLGNLFVCHLTGFTGDATIDISMSSRDGTYDYVTCSIKVTAL